VSTPVVVLKLGSSILRTAHDLPDAVHEIYRHVREGKRVVAVVSALGGTTDELLRCARIAAPEPDPSRLAALLATGERAAVELLALALARAGLPAHALAPEQFGPWVVGPTLEAEPVAVDAQVLQRRLAERPILVLPGFAGIDEERRIALLGRGGSDLSALFVADALGAERCILLKDVDGLFERDPALSGPRPRRFEQVPFARASELDGRIVQKRTVQFAAARERSFEVGALHSVRPTRVGAREALLSQASELAPLRVVLAGLGTVGLGVARELLRQPARFEVAAVASRSRDPGLAGVAWVRDPARLLEFAPDVFVELTGAREAGGWIRAALAAGCDVVTAHKELLAEEHGPLAALAASSGARLCFSAAVGGALPALEVVRRMAALRPLRSVEGVLNATSNFVLTLGEQGASLDSALAEARRAGLAERDVARDLDGRDAACKLALLAREAFGVELSRSRVRCDVVDESLLEQARRAREQGERLRVVARAWRSSSGVTAEVRAVRLPDEHPLAALGVENRLRATAEDGSGEVWSAAGAGRDATTLAVCADLLELARTREVAAAPRAVRA
jgi:homoserine dehydrogenase